MENPFPCLCNGPRPPEQSQAVLGGGGGWAPHPPVKGPLGFVSPALVYLHLLPPLTTLTLCFCSQEQQFRVQDRINSFHLLSVPREFQRQSAGCIWGTCFPRGSSGDLRTPAFVGSRLWQTGPPRFQGWKRKVKFSRAFDLSEC